MSGTRNDSSQIRRGNFVWLHKFAAAAEKALSAEFEHQGLTTTGERAKLVKFLLGDPEDISSKHRPFLWKSAYETSGDDSEDVALAVCEAPGLFIVSHF